MGILFTILMIVIFFKVTGLIFKVLGKILGGVFSIIGWVIIGSLALAVFGVAVAFLPIIVIAGIASIATAVAG